MYSSPPLPSGLCQAKDDLNGCSLPNVGESASPSSPDPMFCAIERPLRLLKRPYVGESWAIFDSALSIGDWA